MSCGGGWNVSDIYRFNWEELHRLCYAIYCDKNELINNLLTFLSQHRINVSDINHYPLEELLRKKSELEKHSYSLQERFAFVCEKYDEELEKNVVLEDKVLDQDKLIEILKRRIEIHEQTIKDYGQALSRANTFRDALHAWLIDNGGYG
jgi:hypothetical protein